MYLESIIMLGKKEKSQALITRMEQELELLTPVQKKWYKSYLDYEKSQFHFMNSEFDNALRHVDFAINEYHAELDVILSHSFLLKGKLHDIKNEREQSILAYKQCVKLDNYSSAIEEAKNYLKTRFKQN